jgi:hypothetical protein
MSRIKLFRGRSHSISHGSCDLVYEYAYDCKSEGHKVKPARSVKEVAKQRKRKKPKSPGNRIIQGKSPAKMRRMNAELKDFLAWVVSKENKPYCWPCEENHYSGKDLKYATYKDCYDCSGLVTAGLYHVTKGRLDWRSTHSAQRLYNACKDIEGWNSLDSKHLPPKSELPCLAFYGPGKNMITHVVVVMPDGRVIGAGNGGDSTVTTPDIAKKRGARVKFFSNHLYRDDFRGFKKIPL